MGSLFVEFENKNALRTYPFASGCTATDTDGASIGTGVLLDAAVYPVNASGTVYLSGISSSGVVSISDGKGVVMTAVLSEGSRTLEFYDTSPLGRHAGTLLASSAEALASLVNVYADRTFRPEATTFAASCVFPVVSDGVTSLDVGGTGAADGTVAFANGPEDEVRVSTDGRSLRFDVVPVVEAPDTPIRHVYCVVDGKTPFRLFRTSANAVALYLDNLDRGDVCANAHREDAYQAEDRCADCSSGGCYEPPAEAEDIPDAYQTEAVDMAEGTDSAFYLTVPNFIGYDNPLSLTQTDGTTPPKTSADIDRTSDGLSQILDNVNSKGVVLQVPGMAKST